MDIIPDSTYLLHLYHLLEFLAAWEQPPWNLTEMAYQWCSAISEEIRRFDQGRTALENLLSPHRPSSRHPKDKTADKYATLLSMALQVGFRRSKLNPRAMDHTLHHRWTFDIILSGNDDEVIADALCALIVGQHLTAGSCAHHLVGRVQEGAPFSPRLRQMIIDVLDQGSGVAGFELETAHLLNPLDPGLDDMEDEDNWQRLLVDVIRSQTGREGLSSHNWCSLGELVLARSPDSFGNPSSFEMHDVDMGVLRSLDDAEDWEKLEVWMLVIWSSLELESKVPTGDIKPVTFNLLRRRPSALQKFEFLCKQDRCIRGDQLRQICNQARAEQSSSVSL